MLMASADAITKMIAGAFEAPQLFAISSFIVVALSYVSALAVPKKAGAQKFGLKTGFPRTMALRSALTVVASVAFFYAFRLLPFADVFLFVALMPILAALLSGPILGEAVRPTAIFALIVGVAGVYCLFPGSSHGFSAGYVWALLAAITGTLSMLLSRFISCREKNLMAQVFYPNLALFLVMVLALPFVWKPVDATQLLWICAYSAFLFAARYVAVAALRILPAYVAMPLMNMQFIWMIGLGYAAFGEVPSFSLLIGAMLVIASGIWLVLEEHLPARSKVTP
jgi:drug/metabolite transporter (DMT)-like permease